VVVKGEIQLGAGKSKREYDNEKLKNMETSKTARHEKRSSVFSVTVTDAYWYVE
jgi:hypothetical protein